MHGVGESPIPAQIPVGRPGCRASPAATLSFKTALSATLCFNLCCRPRDPPPDMKELRHRVRQYYGLFSAGLSFRSQFQRARAER